MIEKKLHSTERIIETAVLVGIIMPDQPEGKAVEYLDELEFLAHTAGAITQKRFLQRLPRPDNRTFLGKGKIAEVADWIELNATTIAIFDDELSPSQIRNLEQVLKCKVLDRTNLILDIFASRAVSAYARTQVELAQYQYLLPRLTGMWTHLEKQRGGIGMKGPGEKEIETDRRIIRDKISLLKEQLKTIDKQKQTQRKHRGGIVRVALVGYTNVGKSTLMNVLAKADVFAENKLFATLDTTVRKVVINDLAFLLTDTVGFIRKLPHHLVESFKSTLDEIREADLLVHVVDISHPNFEEHIQTVNKTLSDIGAGDKPTLLLFNKTDLLLGKPTENELGEFTPMTQEMIEFTWMAKYSNNTHFISAKSSYGLDDFKNHLHQDIKSIHLRNYPHQVPFY